MHVIPDAKPSFSGVQLAELDAMSGARLDEMPFGVIGFGADAIVEVYNSWESSCSGLPPARLIGQNLFTVVAPCMNNYLVAQRFEDEPELDAELDYVFTLRMRPTSVRLRLLQSAAARRRYVLVHR